MVKMIEFYSILRPILLAQIDCHKAKDLAQILTCLKFLKLWFNRGALKLLQTIAPKMKERDISLAVTRATRPFQDRPGSISSDHLIPISREVIYKLRASLNTYFLTDLTQ